MINDDKPVGSSRVLTPADRARMSLLNAQIMRETMDSVLDEWDERRAARDENEEGGQDDVCAG
jgi:hypothetical protein